jgi:hypothetical protein
MHRCVKIFLDSEESARACLALAQIARADTKTKITCSQQALKR